MKYFDESDIYDTKKPSWWKCLLWIIFGSALSLAFIAPAHSQPRYGVGDVATARIVICSKEEEIKTLLDKMAESHEAANAFLADTNNTCDVSEATFRLGERVGEPKMVDDKQWVAIHISPPGGGSNDFTIIPVARLKESRNDI